MPRTLSSTAGTMTVGNLSWAMVLRLALDGGWRPKGTEPPDDFYGEVEADGYTTRQWNPRNYFSRRGQRVTDEDAASIAEALSNAILDVPDHDAVAHKLLSTIDTSLLGTFRVLDRRHKINPFEFFSGPNKKRLRRFIRFCQAGGFRIV
ncbi:MAG: hypothetical protein ACT4PL_04795 [Phycisphaerales bacterium]